MSALDEAVKYLRGRVWYDDRTGAAVTTVLVALDALTARLVVAERKKRRRSAARETPVTK